jgi:hypothetical protein
MRPTHNTLSENVRTQVAELGADHQLWFLDLHTRLT